MRQPTVWPASSSSQAIARCYITPPTKRAKAVARIMEGVPRVLFLTGTPLENRVGEMTALLGMLDGKKKIEVTLTMPRFSADYSIKLPEVLYSLGMKQAFDPECADFSGLGRFDDGSGVYISDVIHKTHIDVDNDGTKAAAVTAVILPKATSMAEHRTVVLDRPFLYAVIDTEYSLPVFFGICEGP